MALLTKEAFLAAAPALKSEEVEVPGGSVIVRELTAGERDKFEEQHLKAKRANFRARLTAWSVRDEAGARTFADSDISALTGLAASLLDPIAEAATRVNALSSKEVEELEGN